MRSTPATIVIHEQSAAAQELIDQALRSHGYRVLVTRDANEVLDLLKRVRVDLMVGDCEICGEVSALADALEVTPPASMLRVVESVPPVAVTPPTIIAPFTLCELSDAVAQALAIEADAQ